MHRGPPRRDDLTSDAGKHHSTGDAHGRAIPFYPGCIDPFACRLVALPEEAFDRLSKLARQAQCDGDTRLIQPGFDRAQRLA